MGELGYVTLPDFADGQVIGRGLLSTLFGNSDFFNGEADGFLPVVRGVVRGWIGNETSLTIFDGYHFKRAGAATLNYYLRVVNDDGGHKTTITLKYNGSTVASTNGGPITGTYDISGLADGIYRVQCFASRADGNYGATMYCMAPYSTYTGSLSYTAAPAIADAATSAALDWNKWLDNWAYFNDALSPNPAFVHCRRSYVADETDLSVWQGWVRHRANTNLHYMVWIEDPGGDDHIHIKYNGTTVVTVSASGDSEGNVAVGAHGTPGEWTLVECVLSRAHAEDGGYQVGIKLLYTYPTALAADYTLLGTPALGQAVYGDTAGQLTRLQLVSDNQASINARLVRVEPTIHRLWYSELGGDLGAEWHMECIRRRSVLYYRGTEVTLRYGDVEDDYEEVSLENTDDGDNKYRTYDLGNIEQLLPGQIYWLCGTLDYAMEF